MARDLGAKTFGIFVLIQTYITIIDKITNFQSWQAVVKYGNEYKHKRDFSKYKSLINFTFKIDLSTAVFGFLISFIFLFILSDTFNWETKEKLSVIIFSLTILFNLIGTATGLLRINDKYKIFAYQQLVSSLVRLIGILMIVLLEGDLFGYVIVWTIAGLISSLIIMINGYKLYKLQLNNINYEKMSFITARKEGIFKFLISSSISSSVLGVVKEADNIIVAKMIGIDILGIYKVAKQIAAIISKFIDPLYQAIYPDLSNYWEKKEYRNFEVLAIKSSLLVTFISVIGFVIFVFIGDYIILWTFGSEFISAKSLVIFYMVATIISVITFPIQPIMLAMGLAVESLQALLISSVLYIILLYVLTIIWGINGTITSYILFFIIITLLKFFIIRKQLKRVETTK